MMANKLALACFMVAAASANAHAQESRSVKSSRTPEQRAAAFDAADENRDGKLSLAEFRKALPPEILAQVPDSGVPQIMSDRDTDRDGFVTKAEFTASPPAPR